MASERRPAASSTIDFGQRLRAAREKRGSSLHDIADATKISITILEALEGNQLKRLPGGIFTRSFVKAYAAQVGLDPEDTLLEFQRAFPDHAPASERVPADVQPETTAPDRRLWPIALFTAVLLMLAAAGTAWYRGWRPTWLPAPLGSRQVSAGSMQPLTPSPSPTPSRADVPPAAVAANDLAAPTGDPAQVRDTSTASGAAGTDAQAGPAPERAPVGTPVTPPAGAPGSPAPAIAPPTAAAVAPTTTPSSDTGTDASSSLLPLRLTVEPTAPCWVKVSADGTVQVARLLQAGERLEFEAATELQIEAGDAGAFAYTIDGKPGRLLGNPGRVARVRIDHANAAGFVAP